MAPTCYHRRLLLPLLRLPELSFRNDRRRRSLESSLSLSLLLLEPLPLLLLLESLSLLLELLSLSLLLLLGAASRRASASAAAFAACSLGSSLYSSRILSVMPPRPMEVKKLMAKRMLAWVSLGKMPSKKGCSMGVCSRSFSFSRPRLSLSSCDGRQRSR